MPMDLQRRHFLRGKVGTHKQPTRMPWLIDIDQFSSTCTQCEQCITSCKENIIVKGDGGFPEVNFALGECTFCGDCASVCPEPLFNQSDDKAPWDYRASINNTCLTYNNVSCQSCQDSCEPRAIVFEYTIGKPPTPSISSEACTGCGACVATCPSQAIDIQLPTA
ncbi:ferredoxin-type protein NapF [Oceanicoccus sagamiensis]|uniref:Ferredoxin-type protein NapF n=2 Tax=Oceanicoccus sagamiensis TaxID=716816 RepID=A0A1X9NA59_9GAMM|nr:ferredoxin-type protein NapF [Oceanicoccus sagamiensis]